MKRNRTEFDLHGLEESENLKHVKLEFDALNLRSDLSEVLAIPELQNTSTEATPASAEAQKTSTEATPASEEAPIMEQGTSKLVDSPAKKQLHFSQTQNTALAHLQNPFLRATTNQRISNYYLIEPWRDTLPPRDIRDIDKSKNFNLGFGWILIGIAFFCGFSHVVYHKVKNRLNKKKINIKKPNE